MPMLRAVRLLQSVEAGITDGTAFEAYLTDAGRLSDFSILLSMREQVRRMANTITTMDAIIASPIATNAVFGAANPDSKVAVQYMVKSPTAVSLVSQSASTLATVLGNATSWAEFNTGDYYENNILSIIHILSGITPGTHATMTALVQNTLGSAALSSYDSAIRAAIESPPTMALITQNANAMEDIISNTSALTIVANSAPSMELIAQSSIALSQLNDSAIALMSTIPTAIKILASYNSAWTGTITVSGQEAPLESNLRNILVNVNNLDITLTTVADIMADATAMAVVVQNLASMQAILAVPSAVTELTNSANVGLAIASSVAMSVLGPNTSAMAGILAKPVAWTSLFASSVAKGFIVSSTTLVDVINGLADLKTILLASATTSTPATLRSATNATDDVFDGIANKVLVLGMRANNIGAIDANYDFDGSPATGTGATATIPLRGSVTISTCLGFTAPTWTVAGIAVTAAVSPEWTWYDMT